MVLVSALAVVGLVVVQHCFVVHVVGGAAVVVFSCGGSVDDGGCVVVGVVAPGSFVSDNTGVTYVCECEMERVRVGG